MKESGPIGEVHQASPLDLPMHYVQRSTTNIHRQDLSHRINTLTITQFYTANRLDPPMCIHCLFLFSFTEFLVAFLYIQCVNAKFYDRSYRGLEDIPDDIPADTTRISLKRNLITTIRRNKFNHLSHCVSIHLANNFISTIEEGAFEGLLELKTMNLNNNLLGTLMPGMFNGLTSLHELDLGECLP